MAVSDITYSMVDTTKKKKKKNVPSLEEGVAESTAKTPAAVYAVVDKKKKKKTESAGLPEERVIESRVSDLYTIVDKKKETKRTTPLRPPNHEGNEPGTTGTSVEAVCTMSYSTNFLSERKYFICLLVTVIVMAVIVSVCFIAAFVEISNATVSQQKLFQQLSQNISIIIQQYKGATGLLFTNPAASCAAVLLLAPSSPSGYYWIRSSNGSAVSIYCDRSCGNITGRWMRVAELDMTNSSGQCPSGLKLNDSNIRTCVGTNTSASCSSVIFPTAVQYSMVCGKIIAYQVGAPNAFADTLQHRTNAGINTYYVDGVSLTHGSPRQHIWTFAAAADEANTNTASNCPCFSNSQTTATSPPDYVGENYFCDTGSQNRVNSSVFYRGDPLWDGAGCEGNNMCCSFNNPPWFYKQLSQPTTDDIEMRVCRDENAHNEDIAIEKVEIYVQ